MPSDCPRLFDEDDGGSETDEDADKEDGDESSEGNEEADGEDGDAEDGGRLVAARVDRVHRHRDGGGGQPG